MSHLQHPCWNSRYQVTGTTQHTHQANTCTHIIAAGRAENYQEGIGRGGESRGCPKPLCPLQVENSMTLGFCFSQREKSDVATNPKSLSHSLTCSPSLSPFCLPFKHTHSLFSSCCNSRSAIRLLLRTNIYTETEQTLHKCICTCACSHTRRPVRMHAWSRYSSSWVWRSTKFSVLLYHCCGYTTQLHDEAEPETPLLAATQVKWAWADCS